MDNRHPKISVIIPIYQAELYAAACFDAILAQSYENWEILAVDDGSTDRSAEICAEYAHRDARIRIFRQENRGVSAARNLGIMQASGEYIAFVDADDRVEPEYFETLVHDTVEQEADIVCCNAWEEDDGIRRDYGCVRNKRRIEDAETLFLDVLRREEQYGYTVWSKLIRADFARGTDFPPLHFGEDLAYMLALFAKTPRVYLNDYTGYIYVRHESGVMRSSGQRNVERRMDSLAPARQCFRLTRSMHVRTHALAAQSYAASIHAAAAATALAGKAVFSRNRENLLSAVKELQAEKLPLSDRTRLALYQYAPAFYNFGIHILQAMGRTR